jgi:hypothetical protein
VNNVQNDYILNPVYCKAKVQLISVYERVVAATLIVVGATCCWVMWGLRLLNAAHPC